MSEIGAPTGGKEATDGLGSRALRGSTWSTLGGLTPLVMATLVSAVAARQLGPTDMGRQSFISFVVVVATTIAMAGVPAAITRYVGELMGRDEADLIPDLLRWIWRLEIVTAMLGGAALVVVALLGATPPVAWIAGAAAVVAGVLHKVPASFLIGSQRWRSASVMVVVTNVVGASITIAALVLGGGITSMLVIAAATGVALLVWTIVIARRAITEIAPRRLDSREIRKPLLRFAGAATIPILLQLIVFQRFEFFFLERSSTSAEIAVYSVAFSAAAAMAALPLSFANVFAPAVAALHGAGEPERIRSGFGRAVRLLTLITIPLVSLALSLGPPAIDLVYGPGYERTEPVFLILTLMLVAAPIVTISNATLFGWGRIRVPVIAASIAAAIDILLAASLVPRFDSVGAAVANVSAQLVAGAIVIRAALHLVGGFDLRITFLLRAAVASVAGGLAAFVIDQGSSSPIALFGGFLAGSAVFLLVAAGLRIIPRDDSAWLVEAAGGRAFGIAELSCRILGERVPIRSRDEES